MRTLLSRCVMLALLLFALPVQANEALNESLIYHVYFGKAEAVQRLLQKGANPNTRDEHDWPVLAVASDRSDAEAFSIARLLIAAGADVNAAHNNNYPLLNAIKNENANLAALLVSADANLRVRSPEGTLVYSVAKNLGNPQIIYYLEKQMFEESQTQVFLKSQQHLKQLSSQYGFHHCAFQYWGFYLRSKQDKDMQVERIKQYMRYHASKASQVGKRALQYFPEVYEQQFDMIASAQQSYIVQILNDMISNRNRRTQGVGKVKDMLKRCHIEKTPPYFHETAAPY